MVPTPSFSSVPTYFPSFQIDQNPYINSKSKDLKEPIAVKFSFPRVSLAGWLMLWDYPEKT